jgi:hypothetical protein
MPSCFGVYIYERVMYNQKDVKRKQLYLEEDLDERLRVAAAAEGRSAAALVRDAVRRYLAEGESPTESDPFLEIAGAFSGGPGDSAAEHDEYLYGRPRRRDKGLAKKAR